MPGDVTDPAHRRALVDVAAELGGARCLSTTPARSEPARSPARRPRPGDVPPVLEVNVVAPMALTAGAAAPAARHARRGAQHLLRRGGRGLRDLGRLRLVQGRARPRERVLAAEEPRLRVYAVDPGDMRTRMHQDAFPGEDISDRPEPEIGGAGPAGAGRRRPARRPVPRLRPGRACMRVARSGVRCLRHGRLTAGGPRSGPGRGPAGRGDAGRDEHTWSRDLPVAAARRPARGQHQRDAAGADVERQG